VDGFAVHAVMVGSEIILRAIGTGNDRREMTLAGS